MEPQHIASFDPLCYLHFAVQRNQDKEGHNVFLKHINKALWSRLHTFFIKKGFTKLITLKILQKWTVFSSLVPFWFSTMLIFVCIAHCRPSKIEKARSFHQLVGSKLICWLLITAIRWRGGHQDSPLLINTHRQKHLGLKPLYELGRSRQGSELKNIEGASKSQICSLLIISCSLFSLYIPTKISSFSSIEVKEHTGSVQLSSFQEQQLAFK